MRAPAVLVDFNRAAAAAAVDDVPEDDGQIADVVLDPHRGQLAVVARRLGEDDGCHADFPQPVYELEEMAAQRVRRRTRAEERGGRIDDAGAGAGLVRERLEAVRQSGQIVFARNECRAIHRTGDVGEVQRALANRPRRAEAERIAAVLQVARGLFDRDDDRRHALAGEIRGNLQADDRLAGAALAGNQR